MRWVISFLYFACWLAAAHAENLCDVGSLAADLDSELRSYRAPAPQIPDTEERSVAALASGARDTRWLLYWHDEFDTPGSITDKWDYETGGWGWFNGELQYYSRSYRNSKIEDGLLKMIVRKEHVESYDNDNNLNVNEYTSAKLYSRDFHITNGRFEIRAKFPKGDAFWPAFWLLATDWRYGGGEHFWPNNGEIDIMEHFGDHPGEFFHVVHTFDENHRIGTQRPIFVQNPTLSDEFHVYAAEWGPQSIRFYFDGKYSGEYRNDGRGWQRWPFDQTFRMMLTLAVRQEYKDKLPDELFPATLEIDYIRVYAPVGGHFCAPVFGDRSVSVGNRSREPASCKGLVDCMDDDAADAYLTDQSRFWKKATSAPN